MEIKLLDISEIKKPLDKKVVTNHKIINRYEMKESPGEKCHIGKVPLQTIPKDMIFCEEISCERTKTGMTDNCVICENKNNDIFIRCKTRYK